MILDLIKDRLNDVFDEDDYCIEQSDETLIVTWPWVGCRITVRLSGGILQLSCMRYSFEMNGPERPFGVHDIRSPNFTTDDMDHVVALIVKKACYEVW